MRRGRERSARLLSVKERSSLNRSSRSLKRSRVARPRSGAPKRARTLGRAVASSATRSNDRLGDAASAATKIGLGDSSVSKETARRIGLSTRMDSPDCCKAAGVETTCATLVVMKPACSTVAFVVGCGAEGAGDAGAAIVVPPAEEERL